MEGCGAGASARDEAEAWDEGWGQGQVGRDRVCWRHDWLPLAGRRDFMEPESIACLQTSFPPPKVGLG